MKEFLSPPSTDKGTGQRWTHRNLTCPLDKVIGWEVGTNASGLITEPFICPWLPGLLQEVHHVISCCLNFLHCWCLGWLRRRRGLYSGLESTALQSGTGRSGLHSPSGWCQPGFLMAYPHEAMISLIFHSYCLVKLPFMPSAINRNNLAKIRRQRYWVVFLGAG